MRHWNDYDTSLLSSDNSVFTLPMRHWNLKANNEDVLPATVFTLPMRHWNYTLTLLHSSDVSVFTLPMRHWNLVTILQSNRRVAVVFTLPMRHWNKKDVDVFLDKEGGFYPTYEALKLLWLRQTATYIFSFYPTYEALKPFVPHRWTHPWCLFLPYLWGIETCTS